MDNADLADIENEAADRGALFVGDTLCRRSQSECTHDFVGPCALDGLEG